jgi:hypothetical protein
MPTVSVYPAGGTTNMPPRNISQHQRAKRDVIRGWSPSTTRRLTQWLYSVEADNLTGQGYALTLTMKDTPSDRDALDRVFRALMDRYGRMGVLRLQWVMEFQRRGTPHYHMAIYTPLPLPRGGWELVEHWMAVAEPYGAGWNSQKVEKLERVNGWLRYMSKHASRSVGHYQRQGMPPGWTRTGRLWGKRGDWPTVSEPMRFDLSREAWFRYRRLVRAYRLADARKERDPNRRSARIASARQMLSHPDPKVSQVRGTSEWVPQHVQVAWLGLLADQGHQIHQLVPPTPEEADDLAQGQMARWAARERWREASEKN